MTADATTTSQLVRRVAIVGTGLIGTSIGLALSASGVDVYLADRDPEVQRTAVGLGAGRPMEARPGQVDHAVICTPPSTIAAEICAAQRRELARTYSDVGSAKTQVLVEAESLGCEMSSVVGGHPFAGRERGGPANADGELFVDRPWVLCPTEATSSEALLAARQVAEACGAVTTITSAEAHDAAAAWLSHVPQLVASALAAGAADIGERELGLAGQGFRDLTRIADSPPGLWQDVVSVNAREVGRALRRLVDQLGRLADEVDGTRLGAEAAELVAAGNRGRALLPAKPGRPVAGAVVVAVPDRPGELARLLGDVAAAGVNLEDLHVQHGTAASRGLVDLDVARADAERLVASLRGAGWHCWAPDLSGR